MAPIETRVKRRVGDRIRAAAGFGDGGLDGGRYGNKLVYLRKKKKAETRGKQLDECGGDNTDLKLIESRGHRSEIFSHTATGALECRSHREHPRHDPWPCDVRIHSTRSTAPY